MRIKTDSPTQNDAVAPSAYASIINARAFSENPHVKFELDHRSAVFETVGYRAVESRARGPASSLGHPPCDELRSRLWLPSGHEAIRLA
jgi:hypothetical protein